MNRRRIGIMSLVAAGWLIIGNVTHPIGSTELYTDGAAFSQYADTTYWVINHLLFSVALLFAPWLAWAWREGLTTVESRTWGTFALILVGLGAAFGAFHLGGIDGVGIPAYAQVLAAEGAGAAIGAEALLKVHLASLTVWTVIFWGSAQTVVGIAEVAERKRPALGWLLIACGILGFAFAGTIAVQGHLTGFSEGVLLRGTTVGLTVWLIWTAWEMARSDRPVVQAA